MTRRTREKPRERPSILLSVDKLSILSGESFSFYFIIGEAEMTSATRPPVKKVRPTAALL